MENEDRVILHSDYKEPPLNLTQGWYKNYDQHIALILNLSSAGADLVGRNPEVEELRILGEVNSAILVNATAEDLYHAGLGMIIFHEIAPFRTKFHSCAKCDYVV